MESTQCGGGSRITDEEPTDSERPTFCLSTSLLLIHCDLSHRAERRLGPAMPLPRMQRRWQVALLAISALIGCLLLMPSHAAPAAAASSPVCTVRSKIAAGRAAPPSSRVPTLLFWDTEGVNYEMFSIWFGASAYQRCPVQCRIVKADGRGTEPRTQARTTELPHAEAVLFWATPLDKGLNVTRDKCPGQLWLQASTEAFDIHILDRTPPTGAGFDGAGADPAALLAGTSSPSPIDLEVSWRRALGPSKVSWLNNWDWNYDYDSLLNTSDSKLRELVLQPATKTRAGRDKDQAAVAAFISNCGAMSPRLSMLSELQRHIPVDSFGGCAHSKDVPAHWDQGESDLSRGLLTQKNRILLNRYKFLLSFENQETPDYVTEKYFHPLQIGVLPIVLGAQNIAEYSPAHPGAPPAFLNIRDFASIADLARKIDELDRDDDAYLEYFAWRKAAAYPPLFAEASNYSWRDSPCQVCQSLHQKLYGTKPRSIHHSKWDRRIRREAEQEHDEL